MQEKIETIKQGFCEKHQMKKYFFDTDCQLDLCPDCYIENHIGHKKNFLVKEFVNTKAKIITQIEVTEKEIER